MPTEAAVRKLLQAREASDALAGVPEVAGIALFGSVARGHAKSGSDIDLLILGTTKRLNPADLRKLLPPTLRDVPIAFSYHTPEELAKYVRRWSRFGAHLKREGRILYDTGDQLRDLLSAEVPITVDHELEAQQQHLSIYARVERFGGRFLFPLAHLYRIGRATVYAVLAKSGVVEFDQESAFREIVAQHPDWRRDVSAIASLAPFYQQVRGDADDVKLPFDPVGPEAENRLIEAREAILRLLTRGQAIT
jgi:predicted nucleotidyltransferase